MTLRAPDYRERNEARDLKQQSKQELGSCATPRSRPSIERSSRTEHAGVSESPNPGLAQQHAVPGRCARHSHSVINDSSYCNALRCAPTRCALVRCAPTPSALVRCTPCSHSLSKRTKTLIIKSMCGLFASASARARTASAWLCRRCRCTACAALRREAQQQRKESKSRSTGREREGEERGVRMRRSTLSCDYSRLRRSLCRSLRSAARCAAAKARHSPPLLHALAHRARQAQRHAEAHEVRSPRHLQHGAGHEGEAWRAQQQRSTAAAVAERVVVSGRQQEQTSSAAQRHGAAACSTHLRAGARWRPSRRS